MDKYSKLAVGIKVDIQRTDGQWSVCNKRHICVYRKIVLLVMIRSLKNIPELCFLVSNFQL